MMVKKDAVWARMCLIVVVEAQAETRASACPFRPWRAPFGLRVLALSMAVLACEGQPGGRNRKRA